MRLQAQILVPSTIMLAASSSMANARNISVPLQAPNSAVQASSSFMGFGFETAFINDYANNFTHNLLNSVAGRLGSVPTIRIGGTSGDRVLFDSSQEEVKVCIAGDCPIGSSATYILGPSYFDGFKSFQDFGITFQAPLGPKLNVSNTLSYVSQAYKNVDNLVAIAIGNEPDLYSGQYNVDYTTEQFVHDSKTIMSDVQKNLKLETSGNDKRIFEVLDFAAGDTSFKLTNAFNDYHIDSSKNVKIAAWHWYQLQSAYNTTAEQQTYLMNHTATTSIFSPLVSQIEYLKTNNPDVQFVLSETGSGIESSIKLQAGFGAALWCIDFQLYSLTQGVARVDATHRPAAPHSYWVPDASAGDSNPGPQTRGVWYALPFIADFIGQNPGKVVEVNLGSDVLTAYAMYDESTSQLSKLALINLHTWIKGGNTGSRGTEQVTFPVSSGNSTYKVQRLVSAAGAQAMGFDYAGPTENITWAGEQWSYSVDQGQGHLVAGVPTEVTHTVVDGEVTIEVSDSEAVLVTF